jgi:hypothetical protein
MRPRSLLLVATLLAAATAWAAPAPATAATVCVWGGTPADPQGTATFTPGFKTAPSAEPLKFVATGPAEGEGCKDTVTFVGVAEAGASCVSPVIFFSGRVKGVDGVDTFRGPGTIAQVHEDLYDKRGNVVGANDVWTANAPLAEAIVTPPLECGTEEGFTTVRFSAVITVDGGD